MFGFDKHSAAVGDIVERLRKDLPPQFVLSGGKFLSVNRVTHGIELLAKRTGDYNRSSNLGFIGRAVLLNSLKWKLREAGYPDDFSALALEAAMVACTRKT